MFQSYGKRISHADIWRKILAWLRRFLNESNRVLTIHHVKNHSGIHDNERANALAAQGGRLLHDIMVSEAPHTRLVQKISRTILEKSSLDSIQSDLIIHACN